jgi:hypothetical protein
MKVAGRLSCAAQAWRSGEAGKLEGLHQVSAAKAMEMLAEEHILGRREAHPVPIVWLTMLFVAHACSLRGEDMERRGRVQHASVPLDECPTHVSEAINIRFEQI